MKQMLPKIGFIAVVALVVVVAVFRISPLRKIATGQ
jgi:hypothetical protein